MQRVLGGSASRQFQQLIDPGTVAGLTEQEVLARFAERRDSVAFEAIVSRHGPMVVSVCRQMLRDPNDVDDAFQAVFLVLVKKAHTLRHPERLAPWLYGVAYRVARRVRHRRHSTDLQNELVIPRLACPVEEREQVEAIHEEINGLPEKYRLAIVLCCLDGLTHDQAAAQLGWPVGTVHGRLSRARVMLRDRLERRGTVSAQGIPQALACLDAGKSLLPDAVRRATVALLSGPVPPRIETLIEGVLSMMFAQKLKLVLLATALATIGLAGATTVLLAYQLPATKPGQTKTNSSAPASIQKVDTSSPKAATPEAQSKVADGQFRSVERDFVDLARMQADAEVMEITLNAQKTRIQLDFQALNNLPELELQDFQLTEEQRLEFAKRAERHKDLLQNLANNRLKQYREQKIALTELQRRIAQKSRSLGEGPDKPSSATELSRRLDRLEEKIDRLTEALSAKPAR